ncbi:MAG: GH92 family glycosyl hydrolase [Bacteroidales bacterium]|nr:GH92 family glycosyl hydrolase [Candidatus Cryptobacteroides onthequi]
MKRYILNLAAFLALASCSENKSLTPADLVNPMIGASTSKDAAGIYHGLGKTFPGATVPFGMVQLSPNTVTGGDNAPCYSDEYRTIEGFSFMHMNGVGWYGDLANFQVMPSTGEMKLIAGREDGSIGGWRSAYDKAGEVAKAGYYSVRLTDYGITAECTAAPHSGILRFTFPEDKASRIQVDLTHRAGGTAEYESVSVIDDHTIEGWMRFTPETGGWGDGYGHASYTVYFHAEFSKPFARRGFWMADIPDGQSRHNSDVSSLEYMHLIEASKVVDDASEAEGRHVGFFAEFPTVEGEQIELKAGFAYTDIEGARRNYAAEMTGRDFDRVRADAYDSWNRELGKIAVEGGTEEEQIVFYTALYHTLIDPRIHADVDGRYVGGDFQIHDSQGGFTKRTIFSGWDTFRSQMPLQTIINPDVVSDMINSLSTMAEQSGRGYFERWEFMNAYTGCMIGNPANSVLADAVTKGIGGFDLEKAYEYAKNSSALTGNQALGYTPGRTSISSTLEYAYHDWCISQVALSLGKTEEAEKYAALGQAYREIFDAEKGWFRPRNADGSWAEWPENARTLEGYGCVESTPYQQGWFVPHDIDGLVELLGGADAAVADLENFFEKAPADMHWNEYYNHANEPVHLIPFMFNRMGRPDLTQKWTRFLCRNAYKNAVAGIVGNEDCGQMSAWYVLAASGIHQACPGDPVFEITSPVFNKVSFSLPNGKTFRVVAEGNSAENIYIKEARLNGKPLEGMQISYQEIMSGGELRLEMGK